VRVAVVVAATWPCGRRGNEVDVCGSELLFVARRLDTVVFRAGELLADAGRDFFFRVVGNSLIVRAEGFEQLLGIGVASEDDHFVLFGYFWTGLSQSDVSFLVNSNRDRDVVDLGVDDRDYFSRLAPAEGVDVEDCIEEDDDVDEGATGYVDAAAHDILDLFAGRARDPENDAEVV
jgi:hypothetical protein